MAAICPAATSTIIVSPIAREAPSTTDATIPDSAAGKTTRSEVWSFGSRRARRSPRAAMAGTADIASSATDAIVGTTMKPMMIPADSALKTLTSIAEEVLQDLRREEGQREVAEDDRRHAGEQLEDRLDRLADARPGVLAEVDRRAEPERDRDEERRRR